MGETQLVATVSKRLGAFLLDAVLVFMLWYFLTASGVEEVNVLLQTLDPESAGALDLFAQAVFKMAVALLLKAAFCQAAYFCLVPAILGGGKTLGKLLFRLSMADGADFSEISPSRLILREFVGRGLLETLLVLPGLVSFGMLLFSKEKISLHDRMARTVVIQDTSYL